MSRLAWRSTFGNTNAGLIVIRQTQMVSSSYRLSQQSLFNPEPRTESGKLKTSKPTQSKDVMILAPEADALFKSSQDLSKRLQSEGVKANEDIGRLGVRASLSDAEILQLERKGYQIFDDSPRVMWQGGVRLFQTSSIGQVPQHQASWDASSADMMGLTKLREAGLTGKGQTVAVLDSGFDYPQYSLRGWQDVVNGSATPSDRVGHGTHVVSDILSAAPDAGIVAVKVMDEDGRGRPSDIVKGLQWVIEQKQSGRFDVDVINMSLGDSPDGYPDENHPVNRMVEQATVAGITVVAAAGNEGPGRRSIGAPAESPYAITVGATGDGKSVSEFSSRGPTEAGLSKPDVVAPGEGIWGWNVPGSSLEQLIKNEAKSSGAVTVSSDAKQIAAAGTSFSTALVSGVLACFEQAKDITPAESLSLLRESASPLPGSNHQEQGAGMVNAAKALAKLAVA